jgi:chromate transport protein ChrA
VFVLVAAVPALLVVVLGYVMGHAVAAWFCGLIGADATRTPEVAGWTSGLVLLAVVVRVLVSLWRRRQEKGRGHQK